MRQLIPSRRNRHYEREKTGRGTDIWILARSWDEFVFFLGASPACRNFTPRGINIHRANYRAPRTYPSGNVISSAERNSEPRSSIWDGEIEQSQSTGAIKSNLVKAPRGFFVPQVSKVKSKATRDPLTGSAPWTLLVHSRSQIFTRFT